MKTYTVYMNKKFCVMTSRQINQFAPGHYDVDGVFETTRIKKGCPLFIDLHLERFYRGAARHNIRVPYSRRTIKTLCQKTIDKNGITEGRLRFSLTCDSKPMLLIVALNKKAPSKKLYRHGARAVVSSFCRNRSRMSHLKNQRWSLFRQALDEAQAYQCDEAILLNNKKELVEGAMTNLFIVKGQLVFTPAIACGCLNGITRHQILRICRDLGVSVRIGHYKPAILYNADEAFLTNAYKGVVPLVKVDGKMIQGGRPGILTNTIARQYQALIEQSLSVEKN